MKIKLILIFLTITTALIAATSGLFIDQNGIVVNTNSTISLQALNANSMTFSNNSTASYKEGRLFYDSTSHTLAYYNDRTNVTVNLSEEQFIRGVNKTGVTITNGCVVTISGAQGSRPKLVLAQATTNISDAEYDIVGVATEDIAPNDEGLITTLGVVHNINTDNWEVGAQLWLSTNAGVMLTNPPPTDYCRSLVGIVVRANSNVGDILVLPQQAVHVGNITAFTNTVQGIIASIFTSTTNTPGWLEVTNGGQHYQTFNAANLTNISDSALSTNIARLDTQQTWSGVQNFTTVNIPTATSLSVSNGIVKFANGRGYIGHNSTSSKSQLVIAGGNQGGVQGLEFRIGAVSILSGFLAAYFSEVNSNTYLFSPNTYFSGTITATNGYILPPRSAAPTWSQIGVSNTIFLWSSNDIPPTTYGSYYNASSNLVNKWSQ